jgi:two-component system, cell cycle sensor histidine kinase and response regulator CckA
MNTSSNADRRIVVVEDEAIVAMDLEMQLQAIGYQVIAQFSRGEEAAAKIPALAPDVILMDIRLAGTMDGIEAARRIRQTLDVPIVYLTAHSDDDTFNRARATDPSAYVLKPFDRRSLKAALDLGLFRHATEAKLRGMERWLTSTLRSIGDAVITTDVEARVRNLNDVAVSLTGWTTEEAVGRPLLEVLPLVDGKGQAIENPVSRVLEEGVILGLSPDTMLVARDGRHVPVQDSAAPIRDEHGTVVGAVIVFRDATDQLVVQEQLRKAEAQLRHSQKMEAIGQLAGGIAHDFNNLMTVVLGYAEILRATLPLTDDAAEGLNAIEYSAQRAADLSRQLLAVGRRQVLKLEVLDLNAVLRDMAGMLGRVIGEDVELSVVGTDGLPAVKADRGQLEQVVLNLASNARDAMPAGGRLELRTARAEVDEWFARSPEGPPAGSYIALDVTDTGTGMDEATRQRIFEPFFTTKEPGRGTGLGLSTVYGIVEQMGGAIRVHSEPGRGTSFRILLPIVDGETALPTSAAEPDRIVRGTETILLVEDHGPVRDLIRHALEHLGYTVVPCADAVEALALLPATPQVGLILIDLVMPRMSGLELLERLRAQGSAAKVLLMSGYAAEAVGRGRLPDGVPFLPKPFTIAQLAAGVRDAIDGK